MIKGLKFQAVGARYIIEICVKSINAPSCTVGVVEREETPLFCGHSIQLLVAPRVIGGEHKNGEFRSVCGKISAPCFVIPVPSNCQLISAQKETQRTQRVNFGSQ